MANRQSQRGRPGLSTSGKRSYQYWFEKGNSLFHQEQYTEAISCYDNALIHHPSFFCGWVNKGVSYYHLNKSPESLRCVDKSLNIKPKHPKSLFFKACALESLGRRTDAVRYYNKALYQTPNDAYICNNYGLSLYYASKFEDAILYFEKAIKQNTKFKEAWNNKGSGLREIGKVEEALSCFNKALEVDPEFGPAWVNKGNILFSAGEHHKAIECYARFLELSNDHPSNGNLPSTKEYGETLQKQIAGLFEKASNFRRIKLNYYQQENIKRRRSSSHNELRNSNRVSAKKVSVMPRKFMLQVQYRKDVTKLETTCSTVAELKQFIFDKVGNPNEVTLQVLSDKDEYLELTSLRQVPATAKIKIIDIV